MQRRTSDSRSDGRPHRDGRVHCQGVIHLLRRQKQYVGQMSAVKSVPVLTLIREYAQVIRVAIQDRQIRTFLIVRNLEGFVSTIWATYSVIYLADARGIALAKSYVAGLPFISALVSMIMILLAAQRLTADRLYGNMIAGQVLWLLGALFFVLSPVKAIGFVILWAVFSALSTVLFRPAEQSYWANVVGDQERAQMFSASSALMSLISLPAGPLAGALYVLFPKGPFLLGIALQVVVLVLILRIRAFKPLSRHGQPSVANE